MADIESFQEDYFTQIRKEAQRLADAGMYRQASVLLSMLHNQWIPESGIFAEQADSSSFISGGFEADKSSSSVWNYRLASLKEQLYEQDLKILFSLAGDLIEKDRREEAASMLNIFTGLLRLGLRASAYKTSSVDVEIELLEQFVLLTNQVSEDFFKVNLKIAERSDWSLFQIPSMSTVPVIKHLLKNLVNFNKSDITLDISISDDEQLFVVSMQVRNKQLNAEALNRIVTKLQSLPWCRFLWEAWHECYPENFREETLFDVVGKQMKLLFYLPVIE